MKKLILIVFCFLSISSFAQTYDRDQVIEIWEGRVMPSRTNLQNTWDALWFKTDTIPGTDTISIVGAGTTTVTGSYPTFTVSSSSGGSSISGTANYLPVFTTSTTIGNSYIQQSSGNYIIFPSDKFVEWGDSNGIIMRGSAAQFKINSDGITEQSGRFFLDQGVINMYAGNTSSNDYSQIQLGVTSNEFSQVNTLGNRMGVALWDSWEAIPITGGIGIAYTESDIGVSSNVAQTTGVFINAQDDTVAVNSEGIVMFGKNRYGRVNNTAYFNNVDVSDTIRYLQGASEDKIIRGDANGNFIWSDENVSGIIKSINTNTVSVSDPLTIYSNTVNANTLQNDGDVLMYESGLLIENTFGGGDSVFFTINSTTISFPTEIIVSGAYARFEGTIIRVSNTSLRYFISLVPYDFNIETTSVGRTGLITTNFTTDPTVVTTSGYNSGQTITGFYSFLNLNKKL